MNSFNPHKIIFVCQIIQSLYSSFAVRTMLVPIPGLPLLYPLDVFDTN